MTRADGGLDRDAKALRDAYGTPYAVARKLVRELGVEAATERCAADHAARAHTLESHVTHGAPECSPVVGGACTVCGAVVDEVAHQDFVEGPRMVVDFTPEMFGVVRSEAMKKLHSVPPIGWESHVTGERVIGRRNALTLLADAFRLLARTSDAHAVLANQAVHRIEAALKGART